MLVEFQDHYIIYVGLGLGMLCCFRGLIESLASCVRGVDDCVDASCCDVRSACGLQDASVCALLLRRAVLLFCLGQPLLLSAVRLLAKRDHLKWHVSAWLLQAERAAPAALGNATLAAPLVRLGVVEMDYLLLALPFAFASAANALAFTRWSHTQDGATAWDCNVSESDTWFGFELTYYVQVLCMNWMLLGLACREHTVLEVYFVGLALALVTWYFLAASRFPHDTKLDHWVGSVAFSVLLLTLLPLWDSLATTCSVSLAACALHTVCVWALVLAHYSAFGNASAAYICLLRFGVTVLCGVFNMVVLALDDDLCAPVLVAT